MIWQGATVSVSAVNGVLANVTDTDPNGVPTVSTVDGSSANVGVGVAGEFGVLTLNANGSYTYVNSNPGAVSSAHGVAEDTFNFTVSDGQGGSANSTLTVLITAPNETLVTGAANSKIDGGNGSTVLDGAAGNMTLVAGSGHQILYGGPNDTLIGGHGAENFMFAPNFGNETIEDFHSRDENFYRGHEHIHEKVDKISLPSDLFANFAAVQADMHSSGANTVITLDANDAITLANFSAAHLHAHNFHFIV